MKIYAILLCSVVLAGCSKPSTSGPASLDEFVQAFSNRYESGQTESIHDLIYDLEGSEYADTLKWMMTSGAGNLRITSLQVISTSDPLPDGFQSFDTMSGVEPNLTFTHVLCCKAAKDKTKYSISWGIA